MKSDLVSQKELIYDGEWDVLFILDACRFDSFRDKHSDYITGELTKAWSEGPNTANFLMNTFDERLEDTAYISSSPWVNSKGVGSFDATQYFDHVIDAWTLVWNDELGTVLPDDLAGLARDELKRAKYSKYIIHFMQPHEPYVPLLKQEEIVRNISSSEFRGRYYDKSNRVLAENLMKLLNIGLPWIYPLYLHLTSLLRCREWAFEQLRKGKVVGTGPGSIVLMKGKKGLRQAYDENLLLALEMVEWLLFEAVNMKESTAVITADHGEMLGENNEYGHCSQVGFEPYRPSPSLIPSRSVDHPVLREVPWFEVSDTVNDEKNDTVVANPERTTEDYQEDLREKLQFLGYHQYPSDTLDGNN